MKGSELPVSQQGASSEVNSACPSQMEHRSAASTSDASELSCDVHQFVRVTTPGEILRAFDSSSPQAGGHRGDPDYLHDPVCQFLW
jgi:hypothetical protein